MQVIETVSELIRELSKTNNSVITVKSRIFFEIIENKKFNFEKHLKLAYPPTAIGSTTIFEATLIAAILTIFNYKKIVEIGTYIGFTTSAIALNSHPDASIYTIDLPKRDSGTDTATPDRKTLFEDWKKNDDFLRQHQNSVGEYYIEQLDPAIRQKINLIKSDSTKLEPSVIEELKDADLFFIDGGHSYEIIAIDTQTAANCIKPTGIILWHDFKSKTHTEVTNFIETEYALNRPVLHIENTMLALSSPNLKDLFQQFIS